MHRSPHLTRRLAAIVFADIAGFSRLMASDEAETVSEWRNLRTEVLEPYVAQEGGRIAEIAGDALLIEFPSAVNSVRWAVAVQQALASRPTRRSGQLLQLRIGINVEDVIDDDGLLQGDGVNIAARVHQAAEPGHIVVTGAVRDYVAGRLPVTFHDLGTPPFKNIDRPVRVFAVELSSSPEGDPIVQPYLRWSARPTVAVLPFRNIGGAEADGYFGEGITEDIIAGLSQSRAFYVIARMSTLRYRDHTTSLRQVGGELGVRYVLDGSLRRRGAQLRITAELVDVAANRPIWTERYDGTDDDLFAFQDRIVASIVGSFEPRLRVAELARLRGRPTDSFDAYDCVLRAISQLYLFTDESYRTSGELLERAIALDPGYAQAFAYKAWRLNFWFGEGRSLDQSADRAQALEAGRAAIALDPEDAFALAVRGHLLAFLERRLEDAMEMFERALAFNQNSVFAWALSGLTCSYMGNPDQAVERLRNAWRLSPFDPLEFLLLNIAGITEFVAGRYAEAIGHLSRSFRANPRFVSTQRILAASLVHTGDRAAAQRYAEMIMAGEPGFRVSSLLAWYPIRREEDLRRLGTALVAAGLPE
jgi:adenylate cyclase